MWIHSETSTWHDKNIQSVLYQYIIILVIFRNLNGPITFIWKMSWKNICSLNHLLLITLAYWLIQFLLTTMLRFPLPLMCFYAILCFLCSLCVYDIFVWKSLFFEHKHCFIWTEVLLLIPCNNISVLRFSNFLTKIAISDLSN